MSSAILYIAIVAIWACVLIPRWLRRDAARSTGNAPDTPAVPGEAVRDGVVSGSDEDFGDGEVPAVDVPAGTVLASYPETDYAETGYGEDDYPETDYGEDDYGEDVPTYQDAGTEVTARHWQWRRRAAPREVPEASTAGEAPPPDPGASRRRMMAARRRLFGMLIGLEIAAIALAVLGLAALWVLIPPSVMLIGYLLLLREAAHADAERAQHEREAERAQARAQARDRERAAGRTVAPRTAVPAGYEDWTPGRDFAPGLAGKYTTSKAEVIDMYEQDDEDFRDEYPAKKLRAVGD